MKVRTLFWAADIDVYVVTNTDPQQYASEVVAVVNEYLRDLYWEYREEYEWSGASGPGGVSTYREALHYMREECSNVGTQLIVVVYDTEANTMRTKDLFR